MRRAVGRFLIFSALVLYAPEVMAVPEFEAELAPSKKVQVGRSCELVLKVSWQAAEGNYQFQLPEIGVGNFSVEETGESNEAFGKEGSQWKRKTFRFRMRADRIGKGTIGPGELRYVQAATQLAGHFKFPAWEVRIVPDRSSLYRGLGIGAAALTVAGLIGFWTSRRVRRKTTSDKIGEAFSLEERYISELRRLSTEGETNKSLPHLASGAAKALRLYLGEKFSLRGRGAGTNVEILELLRSQLGREEWNEISGFLTALEEISYSGQKGGDASLRPLTDRILKYLEGKKVIARDGASEA